MFHLIVNANSVVQHVFLKSIPNTSVIACGEIISVIDIVSTKMTNTIANNVTINCHSKKVYFYSNKINFIAIYYIQFHKQSYNY